MSTGSVLTALAVVTGMLLGAPPAHAALSDGASLMQHDVSGGCPVQGTLDVFGTRWVPYPHVITVDVPNPQSSRPHRFYIDDRDAEGLDDLVWDDFVNGGTWHNDSHGVWIYQETWVANGLQRGAARSLFQTGVPAIDQHVPSYMRPDDPCDEGTATTRDRLLY